MTSLLETPFQSSITSEASQIFFDATVRETHSGSARPTEHPVEDGAVVTDHTIEQPDVVELNGIISNYPILALASARKEPSVPGTDPDARAEAAFEEIQRLRKTGSLLLVSTTLREYENMQIVSESAARDAATGRILNITLRLREFRRATVEAIPAPEPVEATNKPQQDLGRQQTSPAPTEVEVAADSVLSDIADSIGSSVAGLFGG